MDSSRTEELLDEVLELFEHHGGDIEDGLDTDDIELLYSSLAKNRIARQRRGDV